MQVMTSIDDALKMTGQLDELKEFLIGLGVVHNLNNVQLDSFAVSYIISIFILLSIIKDFVLQSSTHVYIGIQKPLHALFNHCDSELTIIITVLVALNTLMRVGALPVFPLFSFHYQTA